MRRRARRPASVLSHANAMSLLFRMIALLVVLVLMFSWARKPQSWSWLLEEQPEVVESASPPEPAQPAPSKNEAKPPTLLAVPTDRDPAEWAEEERLFQAVTDRAALAAIEMPAYWRLMKWARAQSFGELEQRATPWVPFTSLFDQPDKYRGKLQRLRLHIRRIVAFPAPQNSAGVKQVYEAWGPTNESKSYPYVVVFSELPAGMKTGPEIHEEGVFVGYFLKTFPYTAFNVKRLAPLLIGRMERVAPSPPAPMIGKRETPWILLAAIPIALAIGMGIWMQRRKPRATSSAKPTDEESVENWLRSESAPHDESPLSS